MDIIIAIAIALVSLSAILLAVFYYCFRRVFYVRRSYTKEVFTVPAGVDYKEHKDDVMALLRNAVNIPYEDLYTTSFDGKRLRARYYEVKKGAPLEIMFHGYRSNALRDFSGGHEYCLSLGFNALVVDQRAHGESEGNSLSFGVLERYDCKSWCDFAVNHFGSDVKIVLAGISMGATTVMMASALSLPENVKFILADCGFTSPREIIMKVIRDMNLPDKPIYPFIRIGARIFGRFDPDSADTRDALKENKIPLLIIHGEEDLFVPCEMSRQNFDACLGEKKLLTVKEAGHGVSFLYEKENYMSAIAEFCEKYL